MVSVKSFAALADRLVYWAAVVLLLMLLAVVVLGVFFLGRALHGETPLNLLYLGGGIAAVTAALSLFLRAKH